MGYARSTWSPELIIRHVPPGRRRRLARMRGAALAAMAIAAASGLMLEQMQAHGRHGALTPPAPAAFDNFPG